MPNAIAELRRLCPRRPLAPWEARVVAERQAHRLHRLLEITEPPFPEQAIEHLPRVTVRYVRTHRLSGALKWTGRGWCVAVNKNDSWGKMRFSLLHETKHLVDHPTHRTIYRDSRFISAYRQAERAADYFAATTLMPKGWVRRLFFNEGIRDARVLARYFQVSTAAMRYRLDELGLAEPLAEVAA